MIDLFNFRTSGHKLMQRIKSYHDPVDIAHYHYGKYRIRYIDIGSRQKPPIILIHGAPGSLDAFLEQFNDPSLRQSARMVAMDRPGHGYSGLGKALISIKEQANHIAPLLTHIKQESKIILAGHSYGGTIALQLAAEYPEKVGGLILVSAAVDPGHEKIFWVSYLLKIPGFDLLIPPSLRVTNEEKLSHKKELEKMQWIWEKINIPVTIIHSRDDFIVPFENARFAERMLSDTRVSMVIHEKKGHLIPWTHPEILNAEILKMTGKQTTLESR